MKTFVQVPSRSTTDKHVVTVVNGHAVACTCKGFKWRHVCFHVDDVNEKGASAFDQVVRKDVVNVRRTVTSRCPSCGRLSLQRIEVEVEEEFWPAGFQQLRDAPLPIRRRKATVDACASCEYVVEAR